MWLLDSTLVTWQLLRDPQTGPQGPFCIADTDPEESGLSESLPQSKFTDRKFTSVEV